MISSLSIPNPVYGKPKKGGIHNALKPVARSASRKRPLKRLTYPLLGLLFWIYQATDSGDNTLDYEAYGTGYLAAVAYAAQRQAELVEGLQGALMAKKGSLPHSWQWKKGFTDSVLWNAMVVPLLLFCLCCGFLAQLPCPCCSSCGEFRSCRCSAPSTRGLYGTRCAPAAC